MQVTVKYVNPPREGAKNWSIKTTEDKTFYFKPGQFVFEKGGVYDLTKTSDFTTQSGKQMTFIDAVSQTAAPKSNGAAGAPALAGDRWWMPFVSNTVAHAIAAGKIAEPFEIKQWAAAAKIAALEIETIAPRNDDDIDL